MENKFVLITLEDQQEMKQSDLCKFGYILNESDMSTLEGIEFAIDKAIEYPGVIGVIQEEDGDSSFYSNMIESLHQFYEEEIKKMEDAGISNTPVKEEKLEEEKEMKKTSKNIEIKEEVTINKTEEEITMKKTNKTGTKEALLKRVTGEKKESPSVVEEVLESAPKKETPVFSNKRLDFEDNKDTLKTEGSWYLNVMKRYGIEGDIFMSIVNNREYTDLGINDIKFLDPTKIYKGVRGESLAAIVQLNGMVSLNLDIKALDFSDSRDIGSVMGRMSNLKGAMRARAYNEEKEAMLHSDNISYGVSMNGWLERRYSYLRRNTIEYNISCDCGKKYPVNYKGYSGQAANCPSCGKKHDLPTGEVKDDSVTNYKWTHEQVHNHSIQVNELVLALGMSLAHYALGLDMEGVVDGE